MADFMSNTVANLVGTFVGAGLALWSAWWLEQRRIASRELRLLQGLIERLHRSRAIAPGRTRASGPLTVKEQRDIDRCAQSVIATRDRIAAVRDELSVHQHAAEILERMFVYCLTYLDISDEVPESYVEALMALRRELASQLNELQQSVPSLVPKEPGTAQLKFIA